MKNFLRNHWASIAFALCALAFFATEILAPFLSPIAMILLGFVILSVPAFFLAFGVNVNSRASWITFLVLSCVSALAQCLIEVYICPAYCLPLIIYAGMVFVLVNCIMTTFAFHVSDKWLRKNRNLINSEGSLKKNAYFFEGKPVNAYDHKIVGIEEEAECYNLWFTCGTYYRLEKPKANDKKFSPPQHGDILTIYVSAYGDVVACDLRGESWYCAHGVEEK